MNGNKITISNDYLSEENVKFIVKSTDGMFNKIVNYTVLNMNDKMLGYMADYYKLKVDVRCGNDIVTLYYFIKALPSTNEAKAAMVNSMNLFERELDFYKIIKNEICHPAIRPWSPKLIASLKDATVYEDLDARNYRVRNKFHTFDDQHTFQALQTLARFHASSLIYEEKRRKENINWSLRDEFEKYCSRGGYTMTHPWYIQSMDGTLGVIKTHSKYKNIPLTESLWTEVWMSNLEWGEPSCVYRNVICHSDLWNNNIMFHYNKDMAPDDCIFVDFQAARCQPPAGDVMLLLYCNLDREYRDANMNTLLEYYYEQLTSIFKEQGMSIDDVMTYQTFIESAEKYRQWGLFLSACLMPTIWIDDNFISETFSDTAKYQDILTKNKRAFIIKMVETNDSFKNKVLSIYDEIIELYFLKWVK